jgi:hypothetical protein
MVTAQIITNEFREGLNLHELKTLPISVSWVNVVLNEKEPPDFQPD